MAQRYNELSERDIQFIRAQKIFFVGTATETSRVNVSPKGLDSLRVLDSRRVAWLNVTGSGNETAAHVQQQPRMTLMFCAFEGDPLILRLYGTAEVIHTTHPKWQEFARLFEPLPGARQIFELSIELVQRSCGSGVPHYAYVGERRLLREWAVKKGEEGIRRYWQEKNQLSIDGIPTHIVKEES